MELKPALNYEEQILKLRDDQNLLISMEIAFKRFRKYLHQISWLL